MGMVMPICMPRIHFRNGVPIEPNPAYNMTFDGEIARLTISEVFPEDSGTFKCEAKSDFGTTQTTCTVKVEQRGVYTTEVRPTAEGEPRSLFRNAHTTRTYSTKEGKNAGTET